MGTFIFILTIVIMILFIVFLGLAVIAEEYGDELLKDDESN